MGVAPEEVVVVVDVEPEPVVEVAPVVELVLVLVVELALELVEPEELVELVELVELGAKLVVAEVVVAELVVFEPVVEEIAVAGTQLSLSDTTTPRIGSDSDEIGVPGATLTGKVSFCPPNRVTETVHESAEAFGIAASPTVSTADVTATTSFLLPNTVACLLLPSRVRME